MGVRVFVRFMRVPMGVLFSGARPGVLMIVVSIAMAMAMFMFQGLMRVDMMVLLHGQQGQGADEQASGNGVEPGQLLPEGPDRQQDAEEGGGREDDLAPGGAEPLRCCDVEDDAHSIAQRPDGESPTRLHERA